MFIARALQVFDHSSFSRMASSSHLDDDLILVDDDGDDDDDDDDDGGVVYDNARHYPGCSGCRGSRRSLEHSWRALRKSL